MSDDQNTWHERSRFLLIDDTRKTSSEFAPTPIAHIDEVLEEFHDHVTAARAEVRALAGGQAARLKSAQKEHWRRLFSGTFDEVNFGDVERIGSAHSRIGLDAKWYMEGYRFTLNKLLGIAAVAHRKKPDVMARVMAVVNKAVFIDMDLDTTAYNDENNI